MFLFYLKIFKDGKKSTRQKALKKGIHLINVLWVESCRQSGKRVPEDLFPVVVPEEVHTPLVTGKLKRTKSMQPRSFEDDVRNSAGKERKGREGKGNEGELESVKKKQTTRVYRLLNHVQE